MHWFSTDLKETFLRNKKYRPAEMANWTEKSVEYKFNSYGFRGNEFDLSAESIMFLGCSFTLGVGVSEKDAWPTLVASALNLQCVNLGVNGGSNDAAFRLAYNWVPVVKPKMVIWLVTYKERFELVLENKVRNFTIGNTFREKFFETWVSIDANAELNYQKNFRAVQTVCSENNVPLLTFSVEKDFEAIDYGRDLSHYGPVSNKELARKIIQQAR